MVLSSLSSIATVWLIVLENTNWAQVKPSNMPFLAGLVGNYSCALNYKTPPGNHPSEPNYIWLEAGSNLGLITDNDPSSSNSIAVGTPHLVKQLMAKSVTWKTYQENIDGTSCPLVSSYPYACKHNPFVFFNDITNNRNSNSATCIAHVRPFPELATDLAADTVSRYNFITPNLCDDGHDCALSSVDSWLQNNLPAIMNSKAYANGAIFLTWDEGFNDSDGPIGFVVLSPFAKKGYTNKIAYTHSSTVRTLQDIFGVSPYLNDAANAVNLADLFDISSTPTASIPSQQPTSHHPTPRPTTGMPATMPTRKHRTHKPSKRPTLSGSG